jgi:hypothetical protein
MAISSIFSNLTFTFTLGLNLGTGHHHLPTSGLCLSSHHAMGRLIRSKGFTRSTKISPHFSKAQIRPAIRKGN